MTDTAPGPGTAINPFDPSQASVMEAKLQIAVDVYLVDLDIPAAASAAGLTAQTVRKHFNDNPQVIQAVIDGLEARSERTKIDADWVLKKLGKMFDAMENTSIDDFLVYPEYGLPYFDLSKATKQQKSMIESLQIAAGKSGYAAHDVQTVHSTKITLPRKEMMLKILELVGKHVDVQAFRERMEVHMHSVEAKLQAGRERAGLTVIPGGKQGGGHGPGT